jgi:hypothetical protein
MALTHTIFGSPKQGDDRAEVAIPSELISNQDSNITPSSKSNKKGKVESNPSQKVQQPPIKVLRRLHVVLENLSDVGHYAKRRDDADSSSNTALSSSSTTAKLLQEYDLISLSPRNDAVFQSACASAAASDIITLDYTSGRGGVQLPFRIRPADVKAVIARNAVFEVPYAPAILNRNQRKGLIQTW